MRRLTPHKPWLFSTGRHDYLVVAYLLRDEPPAYQLNIYRFNDDGTWELHGSEPETVFSDDEAETERVFQRDFEAIRQRMTAEDATLPDTE